MKNKEKYAKEIVEIACNGSRIAVMKGSRRIVPCDIVRTSTGDIRLFVVKPRKSQMEWRSDYPSFASLLDSLNIDLPMIKWSDDKPWLIEDLKKLEVVEEYEK